MAIEDLKFDVTYRDEDAVLVFRWDENDDELILGKLEGKDKVVLKLRYDDEDGLDEKWCSDDLEYDWDEVGDAVIEALEEEDEEEEEEEDEEEEEEEEEEEDEEEEDEEDEEEEDDGEEDEEEEEEEEDDEEEDEEEDEDEEGDEDEDELDEDEDADYGTAVASANDPKRATLHAVLVGYGGGIGVPDDMRLLRSFFGELQDMGIVNIRETGLFGAEATAENALAAVEAMAPGSNDVVLFYYSGHGCMEEKDRLLCTRGKMLRRQKVVETLNATAARLKMVFSDCCAVEIGRVPKEEKLGAARLFSDREPNLRKLFLGHRGLLDIVSSADFQFSYGGVFTPALVKETLLSSPPAGWDEVFERVREIALESKGAMPEDMRKKFKKAGIPYEDGQKPEAHSLPRPV